MPPRNDTLKGAYISWSTKEDDAIGKIKSSKLSDDGFTFVAELDLDSIITFPKEKMMNKLQGKNIDKIVIKRDGNNVVARAYTKVIIASRYDGDVDYDSLVGEASATCGPNDIFDFNIGAKLALDRLYEGYDMTPKPKRKPYNGLIYIHRYPGCAFDNNSLRRVVNGKIKGCWYHSHDTSEPYIFSDMTDDMLSRTLQVELYGSDAPSAKVVAHFVLYDQTKD